MAGLIEFLTKASNEVGPAMKEVFGERVPNARLEGPTATAAAEAPKAGLLRGLLSTASAPLAALTVADAARGLQGDRPVNRNPRMAYQLGMDQAKFEPNDIREVDGSVTPSQVPKPVPKEVQKQVQQAVVQEKATQVESQRQVVEAGAKEQLRTNQLSRPKAAEAVVKADVERSGEKVTPQEFKSRVNQEVASMKTMDDDQLSKYLSYALIAGGLIASHLDKSGQAGQAFAGGFNAQVDRNQQMAMFKEKQKAAAEAAAAEAARWEADFGIKKSEAESKASDRVARQGLSREQIELERERNSVLQDQGERRLGLMAERNANEAGSKSPKAPYLSFKENSELVSSWAEAKDIELDDGVKESMAQQLQVVQQRYPDMSINEMMQMVTPQFASDTYDPIGFGDNQKRYRVKQ